MRILRSLLATLCALALGAHFLRSGSLMLVGGALAVVPLAFIRRPWALLAARLILGMGALEWLRTLMILRAERLELGAPHLRMTLILAGVAALTGLSAWWLGISPTASAETNPVSEGSSPLLP